MELGLGSMSGPPGSPPGRSCSMRCTVASGCPDSSVSRLAVRPVGAASTIFARFAAARVMTDLTVNDLPQPGPPVSTATLAVSASRTACSCSGARSAPRTWSAYRDPGTRRRGRLPGRSGTRRIHPPGTGLHGRRHRRKRARGTGTRRRAAAPSPAVGPVPARRVGPGPAARGRHGRHRVDRRLRCPLGTPGVAPGGAQLPGEAVHCRTAGRTALRVRTVPRIPGPRPPARAGGHRPLD
jgi:hypothetical protein